MLYVGTHFLIIFDSPSRGIPKTSRIRLRTMICDLFQKRFVIMLFFIEESLITEIFGLNTIGITQVSVIYN